MPALARKALDSKSLVYADGALLLASCDAALRLSGQRDIGLFSLCWHHTRDGFNIIENREASPFPIAPSLLTGSS
jgi:hypothetical protein